MTFRPQAGPGFELDMGAIYAGLALIGLAGVAIVAALVQLLRRSLYSAALWAGAATVCLVIAFGPALLRDVHQRWQDASFADWAEAGPPQGLPAYVMPRIIHMPSVGPGETRLCDRDELFDTPVGCSFDPVGWLSTGTFDAIETGSDAVLRWTWLWCDSRCFDPARVDGVFSPWRHTAYVRIMIPSQGGCLVDTPATKANATVQMRSERVRGVDRPTFRLSLVDATTNALLDSAYVHQGAKPGADRNPDRPLAHLLFDRHWSEGRLRDRDAFDNAVFRKALESTVAAEAAGEICYARPPYPLDALTLETMRAKRSQLGVLAHCPLVADP